MDLQVVILLLMLGYIVAEVNDLRKPRTPAMPSINTYLQQIAAGIDQSTAAQLRIVDEFVDLNSALVDLNELRQMNATLKTIASSLSTIGLYLAKIATELSDPVVGISVSPDTPVEKPSPHYLQGDGQMAAKMSVTCVKKSKAPRIPIKKAASTPVVGFTLIDNEDCSFTVFGVDAAGNQLDISALATLAVSSDTVAVLTVATPVGMTGIMTAVGPAGTANLTLVATWNDGSVGPFTILWPITVTAGPATGVVVVPGVPTVIPVATPVPPVTP